MPYTKTDQAIMLSHLADRRFRLCSGMYKIVDKHGKLIDFYPNEVQLKLHDNMWWQNVILKSRQHGVTTYIQIFILDDTIFSHDAIDSAVIAHKREEASKFFNGKIKRAADHLPDWLLDQLKFPKSDSMTLQIDNAQKGEKPSVSSIYVTTSGRSGTLQNCHVSELGPLVAQQPKKAEELKTGTYNTLHEGSRLWIESTAEGAFGDFYDACMIAEKKALKGEPLSRLDKRFHFFGWNDDKANQLEPPSKDFQFSADMATYFQELEDNHQIKLTVPQRYWYYAKSQEQGRAIKREQPTTSQEAFESTITGAIYGSEIDRLIGDGRLKKVGHDPSLPVHTSWDLGFSKGNATVVVFWQEVQGWYAIIDYYYVEFSSLKDTCKVVLDKPYIYGTHFAPHDIRVHDISSTNSQGKGGKTRKELCREWGIRFRVLRKISPIDRYEQGRLFLDKCYFDVDGTADRENHDGTRIPGLLTGLKHYRHEYDEALSIYKASPHHDWSSNFGDGFGGAAQAAKHATSEPIDEETLRPKNERRKGGKLPKLRPGC